MSEPFDYKLLFQIRDPQDLRTLPEDQLPELADELRRFTIESVSRTGGHLSSSLGTIELTVALHYVFNTPHDRVIWDVGHQAYPHKILTDRRNRMLTLRQKGGVSGFLKREESEYDAFGAGHSSTSISAALGMAVAAKRTGIERQVVAVIGDGALSAGMAYEALNNAGDMDADVLVILNDNDMSISPNVGAMSNYLARILSGKVYTSMREGSKTVLSTIPPVWEFAKRAEEHMKGMIMPGTMFEEMGFHYYGPIDGHDVRNLVRTLQNLTRIRGPRFLHVVTRKGKGYEPAEGDALAYHSVTPFNPETGKMEKKPSGKTYTQVFGEWLCDMAARDVRLIGITPAMREGSGLVEFSRRYPERYFDVGIAEQHAVTFAAGLACDGMKPVAAIYSTFLQRAYDQVIHDVCIQNLPVLFAIDRGGLVGADGPTHHGAFDLSYLRALPNMIIMAPADENECRKMLTTGFQHNGPAAVRYPRGSGLGVAIEPELESIEIGKAEIRRAGKRVALLAFGNMVAPALDAAEAFDATVVNMRFVKPLDVEMLLGVARAHDLLITIEDNAIAGGAGSAVNEALVAAGVTARIVNLGLPDRFIEHGEPKQLYAECGLDPAGIRRSILRYTSADGVSRSGAAR